MRIQKYGVGTNFIRKSGKRKNKQVETITDVYRTYNNANELIKIRYVATHEFIGNTITDYDVLETTISRSELVT